MDDNGAMYKPVDVIFDSALINSNMPGLSGTADRPTFTVTPAIKDVVGFSLLWANVPFTYFVIDDSNNKLTLTVGGTGYVLAIVAGTYNAINIISQLAEATILSGVPNAQNYNWYLDSTTSRLVLYNAANTFTLTTGASDAPSVALGFAAGTTYASTLKQLFDNNDTLIGTVNQVTAPRTINLTGPNQMFLHSDLSAIAFGSVRSQASVSDLIAFFPVNTNYQGIIERDVATPQMIPVTKTDITTLQFYLTIGNQGQYMLYDAGGAPSGIVNFLPLNGEGFQVCIRFYQLDRTNQYAGAQRNSNQPTAISQGRRGPGLSNIRP